MCVSWIWPVTIGGATCAVKPPEARTMRAAFEAAATTDGSSTTMGTSASMPSIVKLVATANGSAWRPSTFSIMLAASSSPSPPSSCSSSASSMPEASATRRRRSATVSV
jgi:hypothetical protein